MCSHIFIWNYVTKTNMRLTFALEVYVKLYTISFQFFFINVNRNTSSLSKNNCQLDSIFLHYHFLICLNVPESFAMSVALNSDMGLACGSTKSCQSTADKLANTEERVLLIQRYRHNSWYVLSNGYLKYSNKRQEGNIRLAKSLREWGT